MKRNFEDLRKGDNIWIVEKSEKVPKIHQIIVQSDPIKKGCNTQLSLWFDEEGEEPSSSYSHRLIRAILASKSPIESSLANNMYFFTDEEDANKLFKQLSEELLKDKLEKINELQDDVEELLKILDV